MRVKKVTLTNFRNYEHSSIELAPEPNILLGENAQGKSNFLEAIELLAHGRCIRAATDSELIRIGSNRMNLSLTFERGEVEENLAVEFRLKAHAKEITIARSVEKSVRVNGVTYSTMKHLNGRLSTVSFTSDDLNLLRSGPKFRRDWLDRIMVNLKPSMQEKMSRYQKVMTQRNRLLKRLFEQGKVTTAQQDELKVWDAQLAQYGAFIIKERLLVLEKLMPKASEYQSLLSGQQESLTASYQFRASKYYDNFVDDESTNNYRIFLNAEFDSKSPLIPNILLTGDKDGSAQSISHQHLSDLLLRSITSSRYEEIARKQTLSGPHRDDIVFFLSEQAATSFASQGQQRSLVLALKLAELKLATGHWQEPPVLLLDDVLAELDLKRQSILLSLVKDNVQTLISTTHLSGVKPEWFERAHLINVRAGRLVRNHSSLLGCNLSDQALSLD